MRSRFTLRQCQTIAMGCLALACLGCETCPPSMMVTLGNGSQVMADAGTGPAAQANTTWAFYADVVAQTTTFLGIPIVGVPVATDANLLFRGEFGPNGDLVRVFDNKVLAPETVGPQLFLDGLLRNAVRPNFGYLAKSYGAGSGDAVGSAGCGLLYFGPFPVARSTLEFSGTTTSLLGLLNRSQGTLTMSVEINPIAALFAPPEFKSQTVVIPGFGIRE